MPLEHVQISNEVISYAKDMFRLKLNQSIYVTLTGHIDFAIIHDHLHIDLPNNEARFIALHFICAEYDKDIFAAANFPALIKEMMGMIEKNFHIVLDENSFHYERLVTHSKFLLKRAYQKLSSPAPNSELRQLVTQEYKEEYECAKNIGKYIEQQANCLLSEEEIAYLTVHIRRITIEAIESK